MSNPQRWSRIRRVILIVGLAGQLPGTALLAALFGALPAVALALLLSGPFVFRVVRGSLIRESEGGLSGAALLAFYTWWGASLFAGFAFLPAIALAPLVGAGERGAAAAALVAGLAGALLGVTWNRLRPRLYHVDVPVEDLHPGLDGYRIAQLSDLHLGGHTPAARVRGWVDRVNALGADLVAVTGDLITHGDQHVERVAEELGRLRARDGVALCMGNHDYFADAARLVDALERAGVEVLRNRGRVVHAASHDGDGDPPSYWLAGVDDTWSRRADVASALAGRPAQLPAIVLAHDPHLFDECERHGATLVLSGHTHGGQLALPLWPRTLNAARVAYRYTAGLYRRSRAWLYVNRGAGTTGPPLRIGSPSEIALITLRRAAG
jgi:predicted MPP superfamily phosphohydrolase